MRSRGQTLLKLIYRVLSVDLSRSKSALALASRGGSFTQPVYEEYKGSGPVLTRCSLWSMEIYFAEQHSLAEIIKANTVTFNVASSSSLAFSLCDGEAPQGYATGTDG